jgi:hypothetical protein
MREMAFDRLLYGELLLANLCDLVIKGYLPSDDPLIPCQNFWEQLVA